MPEESRTGAGKGGAFCSVAGARDVLARETSGDDIGLSWLKIAGGDVAVAGNVGPMLREHLAAEWVNLDKGRRLKAARRLETPGEPTNARK
jgi:hypothetical protein